MYLYVRRKERSIDTFAVWKWYGNRLYRSETRLMSLPAADIMEMGEVTQNFLDGHCNIMQATY